MNETPQQGSPIWLSYLIEIRKRLLRFFLLLGIIFAALFYFSNDLYHVLAQPLLHHLPENSKLIATGIAAPLVTPLKLSFYCALFLSVPLFFIELWGFIAPALYAREKRYLAPLLLLSILLFAAGIAFAYYLVFPMMFSFFASTTPHNVTLMPDIAHYLDFCMKLFFAFGIAFEVPIAIFLLIATNTVSSKTLANKRPYIVVIAFIFGMILTPPDVISQVMLAIPLWLLFEVGLQFGRLAEKNRLGNPTCEPSNQK